MPSGDIELCGSLRQHKVHPLFKTLLDSLYKKHVFLSNRSRKEKLDACRNALGMKPPEHETTTENQLPHWYDMVIKYLGIDPRICPVCKKGLMRMHRELCATALPWRTKLKGA
jgi:hypothetical protein